MGCECEVGIAVEAAKDGLYLSPGKSFSWIGTKGPFGLTVEVSSVYEPVFAIAVRLDANLEAMRSARRVVRPRADLMHKESGLVIEVDEVQHFTSHRLATFDYYPVGTALGFDVDEYKRTCQQYSPYADTAWAGKDTVTFGPRSRGRQRAFYDALKDLSIPASGLPPVVRIPVPDRDVEKAWKNARERVFEVIESSIVC
ncbi:hypothetical protein M1D93_13175 [Arthrobacter sp. Z1-9]